MSDVVDIAALSGIEQLRLAFSENNKVPFGIGATMKFGLVELEEGRVVFEGVPGRHVYNPIGTVHGGYAATLLDSAVGCAVHSKLKPGQGYTTLELKVSYLKAMTEATGPVRAEGVVVNMGRRAAFAEGKLTDANGRLYATATSTLIILDRELTAAENQTFQTRFGYAPVRIPVCLDADIVFVNKNNPITSITMEQLDAIYSKNRLSGVPAAAVLWGDLGVKGELAKRPINAYSRGEGAGTRASFASLAMLNGPFRAGIIEVEDSTALAEAVSRDEAGIAYGPMASWFVINKTLPVVPARGTEPRYATQEMVTTSKYPMPRAFYAYVNRASDKQVDPVINEALHFILNQEGQSVVADIGLLPGPVEFMAVALKRLER